MNICGVLVHSRPERVDEVRRQLLALEGVEVHGAGDDGRMVVTVESLEGHLVTEQMDRMQDIKGVLGATLVYHYGDEDESDTNTHASTEVKK